MNRRGFLKSLASAFVAVPALVLISELRVFKPEKITYAGQDGSLFLDGEVVLTRDMYFESLTLGPNAKIKTMGYTVQAREWLEIL